MKSNIQKVISSVALVIFVGMLTSARAEGRLPAAVSDTSKHGTLDSSKRITKLHLKRVDSSRIKARLGVGPVRKTVKKVTVKPH